MLPQHPKSASLQRDFLKDYETAIYGATFLAYLIETFNTCGFNFATLQAIIESSQKYINQNNVIMQFVEEAFDKKDDDNVVVFLNPSCNPTVFAIFNEGGR